MKLSRITLHLAFGILVLAGFAGSVVTAAGSGASKTLQSSQGSAYGGGSVQGYAADSALQNGLIVQLSADNANKVAPVSEKNRQQMYGVTVDPHQLSLTLSDSSLANEVFVATSGTYNVLVSNQAGAIKQGDYVTLSSVDGVAMNAGTSGITVFGRATGSFDGKANVIGNATLKGTDGQSTQPVTIGVVPVTINIQRNPLEKSTKANLPESLQRIGQAVAEKPISPMRIIMSMIITGLSVIVALVMLYSGIRNSLIAIGRNPLSRKTIFRGLLEVILASLLILIIGLFAVYLLLKL